MGMAKKEDLVYVNIENPADVRRALLEASKSLVHILKGQHSIKQLRAPKHRMAEELRSILAQINELVAQAKQLMPELDAAALPQEPRPTQKMGKVATAKRKSAAARKQPVAKESKIAQPAPAEDHIDRLERELRNIEQKLKSL